MVHLFLENVKDQSHKLTCHTEIAQYQDVPENTRSRFSIPENTRLMIFFGKYTRYPTRTRSFQQYPNPTRNIFRIIGYFGYRVFEKVTFLLQKFTNTKFCRKNLQIRHFCREILQMRALQRFVRFSAVPKRLPTSATLDHYDINLSTKHMFD